MSRVAGLESESLKAPRARSAVRAAAVLEEHGTETRRVSCVSARCIVLPTQVCWCGGVVWGGWPLLWPQGVLSVLVVFAVAGTGPLCVLLLSVAAQCDVGQSLGMLPWQPAGLGAALVPRVLRAALHAALVFSGLLLLRGLLFVRQHHSHCVCVRCCGVLRVWAAAACHSVGLDFPSHNCALTVP